MPKYLIVNSSPIITLSKAKLLFLLLDNKENLIIPNDVYNEVLKKEGKIQSAKEAITQLIYSGLYLDQNLIQKVLSEKVNETWDFI